MPRDPPDRPRRHHRSGTLGPLAGQGRAGQEQRHPVRRRPYAHACKRRGVLPREKYSAGRQLRRHPGESKHRRRRAGDTAQPACRTGDAGRRRGQAHPCAEAAHARPAERPGHRRCGQESRYHARGRLQSPLPSFDRRNAKPSGRRPARPGHVHGGAAHHQHRTVHRSRQLAGAARRGAGRRPHRGRRAFHRPHDRVRRHGARRALHHRPLHSRPLGRHVERHAALREAARPDCCSARSRPPPR